MHHNHYNEFPWIVSAWDKYNNLISESEHRTTEEKNETVAFLKRKNIVYRISAFNRLSQDYENTVIIFHSGNTNTDPNGRFY